MSDPRVEAVVAAANEVIQVANRQPETLTYELIDRLRDLHNALAALSAASPPAEGVTVRAAVGIVRLGDETDVYVWGRTGASDATAMRAIDMMAIGSIVSRAWANIAVSEPVVPEIAARVDPAGGV